MKNAQITPLTMDEFIEIGMDPNEIETVEHAGMIAAKFVRHHEHGDMILVSGQEEGGFMIHQSASEVLHAPRGCVTKITDAQLADIIVESGESVETSSHGEMNINTVLHPTMGKLTLVSSYGGNGLMIHV